MRGVYYDKRNNKWKAIPRLCGTTRYLGNYATEEEAEAVKNAYMHKIKDADNPLLAWLADIFPQYGSDPMAFLPISMNAIKNYLSESSKFSVEAYVTDYVRKRLSQVGNTTMEQIHRAEALVNLMPWYMYEYLFQGLAYNSTLKCPSYYRMRQNYHSIFPEKFDLGWNRNDSKPGLDKTNSDILRVSSEYKEAKEKGDKKRMRDLEKYVLDTYGATIDRILFDARVVEEELK